MYGVFSFLDSSFPPSRFIIPSFTIPPFISFTHFLFFQDKRCWVPDGADIWRLAFVIARDGNSVSVEPRDGGEPETYSLSDTHSFDATHESDLDDAAMLNNLHEAPLLSLIRRRFEADKIYTNVGGVLISVNPYKFIPRLYTLKAPGEASGGAASSDATAGVGAGADTALAAAASSEGAGSSSSSGASQESSGSGSSAPHVYGIAQQALEALTASSSSLTSSSTKKKSKTTIRADAANQSVVISGESGAGKTEASKHVMRFLINESLKRDLSDNGTTALTLKMTVRGAQMRKLRRRASLTGGSGGGVSSSSGDLSSPHSPSLSATAAAGPQIGTTYSFGAEQRLEASLQSGAGLNPLAAARLERSSSSDSGSGGIIDDATSAANAGLADGDSAAAAAAAAATAAAEANAMISSSSDIESRLMLSNVILEAFGNAKTVRNDNSSRFGKYIKLQYNGSGRMVQASTQHFLLEKSRLVAVAKQERNYHVFYELLRGLADTPLAEELHLLEGATEFNMTSGVSE